MRNNDQSDIPVAYPPPGTMEVHLNGPQVTAPPPMGYPMRDVSDQGGGKHASAETTTRGEGFWKGCVAALCCCWVVEFCCGC